MIRSAFGAAGEPRFVAAACLVGVITGLAAILLVEGIGLVQRLGIGAAGEAPPLLDALPRWRVVLVPALGGLLVGGLGALSSEVRGHGVPEVMEAVALRGGRIRKRVAWLKALASALTIGSGGSVGREGPIVHVGAGLGSTVAQLLRLPADRMRTLTAAGAAGGIAAAFNAPMAGAFFALEVIARNFALPTFGPVVLGAVFATLVSRLYFGEVPAFRIPPFELGGPWDTGLAALLGVLCGLVSVGFIAALAALERWISRLPAPVLLRPALGGLLVGGLLLVAPELYGAGHATMDATLRGELALSTLALLLLLKPLATSVTLASGGSGGVFLPALYVGGLAGALFGALVADGLPVPVASPGAYALVGMAAVLAGTSHAPITALLLAFEMTRSYALILPVMVAVALATLLARWLRRESIYSEKLVSRGIDLDRREDLVLRGLRVGELMDPAPTAVRNDSPLEVVLARFLSGDASAVFVTDAGGRVSGQVSIHDVKSALAEGEDLGPLVVAGDVSETAVTAPRDLTAADAMERLARGGRELLAVVDDEGGLVGALPLSRITDALAREVLHGEHIGVVARAASGGTPALRLTSGLGFRSVPVPRRLVGRCLRDLEVRTLWGVSVIALRRGGVDRGADPDEPLTQRDALVAMGAAEALDRFESAMR